MEEELQAVQLVASSGEARSLVFESLRLAKEKKLIEAKQKMKEANELIMHAHKIQTALIQQESGGTPVKLNLLMVHAQDHLMTSMLAKDLVSELLEIISER